MAHQDFHDFVSPFNPFIPIFINWTNPFRLLRLLGSYLQRFNQILTVSLYFNANRAESDQTPRSTASDQLLHCLLVSYKTDDRRYRFRVTWSQTPKTGFLARHAHYNKSIQNQCF